MNINIGTKSSRKICLSFQNINRKIKQKNAVEIILGESKAEKNSLNISGIGRTFSKQAIGALIDASANPSSSELLYYFEHYNNPYALLDAINFGENVSVGCDPNFKDYGVISFLYQGKRQIVPNYAVPKMNACSYEKICAVDNTLILKDKSYCCWTSSNGKKYTWAVNGGRIGWASSESLLSETMGIKGNNYKWEMRNAANILTSLAGGTSLWGIDRGEILSVCKKVGIEPGFFSVDAGNGKQNYYLHESGKITNLNDKIYQMNTINWLEIGYQEGDVFSIYGRQYSLNQDGYLRITIPDKFLSTEIIFPNRQ